MSAAPALCVALSLWHAVTVSLTLLLCAEKPRLRQRDGEKERRVAQLDIEDGREREDAHGKREKG